jgi:aryl-alcohol dehydrogenase-like predicted oxidoreductase
LDALAEIAEQNGKSIPQVALNLLLQWRTVCNAVAGARNEAQLLENQGRTGVEFNRCPGS